MHPIRTIGRTTRSARVPDLASRANGHVTRTSAAIALVLGAVANVQAATLLSANFDADNQGFEYVDDLFAGTSQPDHASGVHVASAGFGGTGGLQVNLGGISSATNVSGGWRHLLNLSTPSVGVSISFRYKLGISPAYTYQQFSRVMLSFDDIAHGRGAKPYIDHLGGSRVFNTFEPFSPTTDWQQASIYVGDLGVGDHPLHIGVYNNQYEAPAAQTTLQIDDVEVTDNNPLPVDSDVKTLVNQLDLDQFKSNILTLTNLGNRCRSDSCSPYDSYTAAQSWIAQRLEDLGYVVEYHTQASGSEVSNLYATKIGTQRPDQMYIVSAHLDGHAASGAGADDDASGVSLVLELARVLAAPTVHTDKSVRFIFWDKEELSFRGSCAYVSERRILQGIESPPGSGIYPEPNWLGMLQHDMILFDHGERPVSPSQSPFADLDVEWRKGSDRESDSRALALTWHHQNGNYSTQYPSTAYDQSSSTDDGCFRNYVAAVSVRENRRSISAEWANPHWHQATDVYATYSDEDFALGFNAVQASLGTVATLANASIDSSGDLLLRNGFESGAGGGPAP